MSNVFIRVWQSAIVYTRGFIIILLSVLLATPIIPFMLVYVIAKYAERLIVYLQYGDRAPTTSEIILLQDTREYPAYSNILLHFDGEMSFECLTSLLLDRIVNATDENGLIAYPRLRKHIAKGCFNYFWRDDDNFVIKDHVFVSVRCAASKEELEDQISALCNRAMDESKSPWQVTLLSRITRGNKINSTLVFRAHHCLADGTSVMGILHERLCDEKGKLVRISHPPSMFRGIRSLLTVAATFIKYASDLFSADCFAPFVKTKLTGTARYSMGRPINLNLIKRIKNETKTTVNDVIVSCYTATLREIMFPGKSPNIGEFIQLTLPVSTRRNVNSGSSRFENNFIMLPINMPLYVTDPKELLLYTKALMDDVKQMGMAFILKIQSVYLSTMFPNWISKVMFDKVIFNCGMSVLSNFPGPQSPIHIGGCKISSMVVLGAYRYNIPSNFTVISYNGCIYPGVGVDVAARIDPAKISSKFDAELNHLARSLGIDPSEYQQEES